MHSLQTGSCIQDFSVREGRVRQPGKWMPRKCGFSSDLWLLFYILCWLFKSVQAAGGRSRSPCRFQHSGDNEQDFQSSDVSRAHRFYKDADHLSSSELDSTRETVAGMWNFASNSSAWMQGRQSDTSTDTAFHVVVRPLAEIDHFDGYSRTRNEGRGTIMCASDIPVFVTKTSKVFL